MTTSVFIPTTPSHLFFLDNILNLFLNKSTIKPNQIVVSISDGKNINHTELNILREKFKDVEFVIHENILLAGPNRQVSKDYCHSDIIIYQDSDDLPHKQRIEVILHVFKNNDIVHLNHSYQNLNTNINSLDIENLMGNDFIDLSNINYVYNEEIRKFMLPNNDLNECIRLSNHYGLKYPTHAGAVSIKKEVLNDIKWKNRDELRFSPRWFDSSYKGAEDYEFCVECLKNYNKSMIIDSKIYYYYG